jgi:hypothetical protein
MLMAVVEKLEEFAILYLEGCSDDKNVESKSQQTSENL